MTISNIDFSGWIFRLIFKYRNKCNIFLFNWIVYLFGYIKNVKIGNKVRFNGIPIFRRYPNSTINIGNFCEFNSYKHSVAVGLTKPCTFVTIKPESEIRIGNYTGASGVVLVAAKSIRVGNNVMIGANCVIADNDFHMIDPSLRHERDIVAKPVVIEDNVFLGFNCFVLKGVTIGKNAVIGANSVVLQNIPANAIAIGNPCKVIIRRNWIKQENHAD